MKFTAAIFVAFILAVGFGSTPVAASGNSLATSLFGELLNGVNTLIDLILKALFNAIDNLLFLLLKTLLNLATILVPGGKELSLVTLLPPLLALKKPTLATLIAAVFKVLCVDGSPILALIPPSIGKTPIILDTLLKTAAPLLTGKTITFENLLLAVAIYLSKYEYSIKLPSC